jgi:hypothetical protein
MSRPSRETVGASGEVSPWGGPTNLLLRPHDLELAGENEITPLFGVRLIPGFDQGIRFGGRWRASQVPCPRSSRAIAFSRQRKPIRIPCPCMDRKQRGNPTLYDNLKRLVGMAGCLRR